MTFYIGQTLYRPDNGPATVISIHGDILELSYSEGGTGWWPASSIYRHDPNLPPPDWSTFKTTLLADPAANAALAAALPQAPGAVLALPAALMAMAEGGNPADFYAAWGALRAASLIPEPLQTAISALAHACNLPPEVVGFLG